MKLNAIQIDELARKYGRLYDVDPALVRAVIYIESGGETNAIGDGGESWGLMQLHRLGARATWHANGFTSGDQNWWLNAENNVRVGTWFLGKAIPAELKRLGHADTVRNRIVAYNAGASRVARSDDALPAVTQSYLRKVAGYGLALTASARASWPAPAFVAGVGLAILSVVKALRDL